ncbi:MAG: Cna B-type domain-containing protein [Hornefia sp.]|nr:Cna B-type domain-containing protein [Hornefia sp.]
MKSRFGIRTGKRVQILIVFVIVVFAVFLYLLAPFVGKLTECEIANAKAQGNDVSRFITNFSVSPKKIMSGSNVTVRLDFKDTEDTIKPGDFIDIKWPTTENGAEVFFEGYEGVVPLKDALGRHIADATIERKQARIEFTDKVNNLHDIQGFVEFELQGHNYKPPLNQGSSEWCRIWTHNSNFYKDVKIERNAPGFAKFYYKVGGMEASDVNSVKWHLLINNHRETIGNKGIKIEDDVQYGHVLKRGSFAIEIYNVNYEEYASHEPIARFEGPDAIEKFQKEYPGSEISVSGDNKHFNVDIPKTLADGKHIQISYKTKVTDSSIQYFINNSSIMYTDQDGYERHEVENFAVKNVHFIAGASGTVRGELKIRKVVEGTTDEGIEGVVFSLKRKDGGAIENGKTVMYLTTGKNGYVGIKNLPLGEYKLREVSAPPDIDFNPNKAAEMTFTVSSNDTEGIFFTIDNPKKEIDIEGEKTWKDNYPSQNTRPEHIIIRLLADGKPVKNQVKTVRPGSDGKWKWKFTGLKRCHEDGSLIKYTIREDPVEGYESKVDGYNVTNIYSPPTPPEKDVFATNEYKTSIDGKTVKKDADLYYTVTYKNTTTKDQNVTITDKIPKYTEFVEAFDDGIYKNGTITWTKAALKKGESWTIKFKVKVKSTEAEGKVIRNSADVRAGENEFTTNETVNPVPKPEKEVYEHNTTTIIDGHVVKPNQILDYVIIHKNTSNKVQNLYISDAVPKYTTLENVLDGGVTGSYADGRKYITWTKKLTCIINL